MSRVFTGDENAIYLTGFEHFDFLTVGKNIYRVRKAIK
jgi:hypothetical protein